MTVAILRPRPRWHLQRLQVQGAVDTFGIGELARRTGTDVQTIRWYERIGLLPPAARTGGGQRRFDRRHLERLTFIRHARELGFPLDAVRSLLRLVDEPDAPCEEADAIARARLAEVESRIRRLEALREELVRMIEACRGGRVRECRVIGVLADHELCLYEDHRTPRRRAGTRGAAERGGEATGEGSGPA